MSADVEALGIHPTARKFADQVCDSHGFETTVEGFSEGTKTANDVVAAVGYDVTQIIKDIVTRVGGKMVVALTSGADHVDEASLGSEFDVEQGSIRSTNLSEVKVATGWSIGGVPPTCHAIDCPILVDPTFESFDRIWATTGTPEAVFQLTPDNLRAFSAPRFVDVFE